MKKLFVCILSVMITLSASTISFADDENIAMDYLQSIGFPINYLTSISEDKVNDIYQDLKDKDAQFDGFEIVSGDLLDGSNTTRGPIPTS